eukprot:m.5954 g.5954  ORF g.5954 m.5954 type:complete len:105 (-) comp8083_c0_seq2:31-345(-)
MSLIELFKRTARLETIVRDLNTTLQARIAADCCQLLQTKANTTDVETLVRRLNTKANQTSLLEVNAQVMKRLSQSEFEAFINSTANTGLEAATPGCSAFVNSNR